VRILVLAFDCNPILPSLPIVAYNTCRALAERMEVSVVSYKQPEEFEIPGAKETVFIDVDWFKSPIDSFAKLLRGGNSVGWGTKTAFTYPSYVLWEHLVWKRYRERIEAGEFDLIFRVSPMSPVLPSPIAKKSPIPFVIGPINGGLAFPEEIDGAAKSEREWMHGVRDLHRKLPYHESTFENADAILAGFEHTIQDLPASCRDRAINFPEVGFDPERFYPAPDRAPASEGTHFVYVGRLVPNKFADVLVRAFAQYPELRDHRLTLVGYGPEEEPINELIEEHDLQGCVRLTGGLEQSEVARVLREAHVFAFPSIRELGAGVVVEAMASGLPCIVADAGGPGNLVDESRGLKVPLAPKDQMVEGFGKAMLELARDPQHAYELGSAALDYAQGFSWDAKNDHIVDVFRWVMGELDEKPEFY
jgi:glycosyltransferase involved in cell wall biosynthesis